jgi:hypothetical protein
MPVGKNGRNKGYREKGLRLSRTIMLSMPQNCRLAFLTNYLEGYNDKTDNAEKGRSFDYGIG